MPKFSFLTTTAIIAAFITTPSIAFAKDGLTLQSTSIAEGQTLDMKHVYKGFGCEGENISPALSWSGTPEGTKSFAITVYDPDAPTGSGWWHWFAFNIPTSTKSISEGGTLPEGAITLRNDYGANEFGGACPPKGEVHRYQFTIHALDTTLELDPTVSNALAGYMVNAHSIESDTITAVYNH